MRQSMFAFLILAVVFLAPVAIALDEGNNEAAPAKIIRYEEGKVLLRGRMEGNAVAVKQGEDVTFELSVENAGEEPNVPYFICWERKGDDGITSNGKEQWKGSPLFIVTSMDKPGFVRITASIQDADGKELKGDKAHFWGGFGVDIENIPNPEEPKDFDRFWEEQKARLNEVPLVADMKKVSKEGNPVDVYAVTVACTAPLPVTGYLAIPAGAENGSLPIHVIYFGYGVSAHRPPNPNNAKAIFFWVNAHGYELDREDQYYRDFHSWISDHVDGKSIGYAFSPHENQNPRTCYFNGMTQRLMRSLQFVKTLPQWNGKDLIVEGGSQGGLQTIWAASLDHDVTLARPGIPWGCDFEGELLERLQGGWRIHFAPGLRYYDCIFHARRIKCRVDVTRAGLGDYVCPPSGVALMFNNLNCPKTIRWVQGSTHGYVPPNADVFLVEKLP